MPAAPTRLHIRRGIISYTVGLNPVSCSTLLLNVLGAYFSRSNELHLSNSDTLREAGAARGPTGRDRTAAGRAAPSAGLAGGFEAKAAKSC